MKGYYMARDILGVKSVADRLGCIILCFGVLGGFQGTGGFRHFDKLFKNKSYNTTRSRTNAP